MNKKKISFISEQWKIVLDVELRESESVSPHLDIDFNPIEKYTELSICGTLYEAIKPYKSGGYYNHWRDVGGGQITSDLKKMFANDPKAQEIAEVWERWHLNGLKAGCREQDEFVRNYFADKRYTYDKACEALEAAGLYTVKRPLLEYKYGYAWLVERLPEAIIAQVESWS